MYNNETLILVYNPIQKQFHTETIGKMLEHNARVFFSNTMSPWYVLGFCRTMEESIQLRLSLEAENPKSRA